MADSLYKVYGQVMRLAAIAMTALMVFPYLAWAAPRVQQGFLETPSEHSLFYRYKAPLRNSPTLILLNGLDHDAGTWKEFLEILERANDDIGVLAYDMRGMGKSLQAELMQSTLSLRTFNNLRAIGYEKQTEDLKWLIEKLNLRGDLYFLGLSYGSAIALDFMAKYPDVAKQAVLASPYLAALPQQDSVIRQEIAWVRKQPANPLNLLNDDRLYDLFLIPIVSIYPVFEPILAQEPWRISGVYRMVRGAKNFSALNASQRLRPGSIHVLWAEKDQYLARDQVINFHRRAPKNIFASETIVKDVHHDIVRQVPHYLAAFVLRVLSGNVIANGERRISAYPYEGYAEKGVESWKFESDSKPFIDQFYLPGFETPFSPITWALLEGNGYECKDLLEKH